MLNSLCSYPCRVIFMHAMQTTCTLYVDTTISMLELLLSLHLAGTGQLIRTRGLQICSVVLQKVGEKAKRPYLDLETIQVLFFQKSATVQQKSRRPRSKKDSSWDLLNQNRFFFCCSARKTHSIKLREPEIKDAKACTYKCGPYFTITAVIFFT